MIGWIWKKEEDERKKHQNITRRRANSPGRRATPGAHHCLVVVVRSYGVLKLATVVWMHIATTARDC